MAAQQEQNPGPQDIEQPAPGGEQAAQAQPADAPRAELSQSAQAPDQRQPTLEEVIAIEQAKLQQRQAPPGEAQGDKVDQSPGAAQAPETVDEQTPGSTEAENPPEDGAPGPIEYSPMPELLGGSEPSESRKISVLHVAVLLNTVLVMFAVGGLFYVLLPGSGAKEARSDQRGGLQRQVVVIKAPPAEANAEASRIAPTTQPTQPAAQAPAIAVSWQQAETAFAEKNFQEALSAYGPMLEVLQQAPAEALAGHLCQLRTAQCLIQLGRTREGQELLAGLLTSSSPIIRAAANYDAAALDIQRGQYMQARMRLYAASACLGSLEAPSGLERDCDFQVARALTQEALAFCGDATPIDWKTAPPTDPFQRLDPRQLRKLLREGSERLAQAALGPLVWRIEGGSLGRQWMVVCVQSPLEEVLARFAAEAKMEIRWVSVGPDVRRRSVTLLLSGVSEQRFAEVCCGVCGLVARLTGEEVIVHNPAASATLSAQKELLVAEAASGWRRFFLRAPDDPRVPQGYLALAVLEAAAGDPVAALRDAQLTAERFPGSDVAPLSLLIGARIRIQLRDYNGARAELLRLLGRYPNCPSADQAYLSLGQVTADAGLIEEAIGTFNKLYYLNLSAESRAQACLGLGRCYLSQGRFDQAVEWLDRCLKLPEGLTEADLAHARLLLGEAAVELGNLPRAQRAFQDVLAGQPSKEQLIEAGLKLADVWLRQDEPVAALGMLRQLEARPLDEQQRQELYVLTARALRAMGLPERAAAFLRGKMETSPDLQVQTRLSVELARCQADDGDMQAVMLTLTEALPKAPPGPVAQGAACYLAEIALKMGKLDEAVAVIEELLKSPPPPEIRQRALEILGAARILQKDYRKAAEAYSGMVAVKAQEAKTE